MKYTKYSLLFLFILLSGLVYSQTGPPIPNPPPPGEPIDIGLWILAIIATGFGISKKR